MYRSRLFMTMLFVAACRRDDPTAPTSPAMTNAGLSAANAGVVGNVYTASNSTAGNAVLVFDRAPNGSLTAAGSYATGGVGTGAGLGNQSGITLADGDRFLLVVNAGSNTVSSFRVNGDGSLELAGAVSSGGAQPISVTAARDLVYVLNAGGSGNVAGFTLGSDGSLTAIPGSSRPLSTAAPGPAQIAFDPTGRVLVVTEKNTNRLTTYVVGHDGLASGPQVTPSAGTTPFGFAFSHDGLLVVSEAFGGTPDASALSSYEVGKAGSTQVVSASVPTTETAACWVVITNSGRFAYTTNTGSGSVTGYAIVHDRLERLDPDGRTGATGPTPIDLALSRDSRYLYTLNSGNETISAFAVNANGSLASIAGGITGLPDGANGLAAR